MRKSVVLASTLFGFLSLALSPAVKAEVTITPRNNGDVVVSPGNGGCTVLFNSRGEIITNGRNRTRVRIQACTREGWCRAELQDSSKMTGWI